MDDDENAAPVAWLFLQADAVPEAWQARSRPCAFVPLTGPEVRSVLRGSGADPAFGPADVRLLELVARGRTTAAIARDLGVSRSTVQRRTARLRERLGAASVLDAALQLAQQGFAVTPGASPGAAGEPGGA